MTMTATPLMQQYRDIKARHQDAILLFRMGDFYDLLSAQPRGKNFSGRY